MKAPKEKKMDGTQGTKQKRYIFILLLIGVLAVNIKRIFMDFEIDAEYAIAMSYRLATGDKMFLQMWEIVSNKGFPTNYNKYRMLEQDALQTECSGFVMPYGDMPTDGENIGELVYYDIINKARRRAIRNLVLW